MDVELACRDKRKFLRCVFFEFIRFGASLRGHVSHLTERNCWKRRDTYLYGQKCLVDIRWVLLKEPSDEFDIRRAGIDSIKLSYIVMQSVSECLGQQKEPAAALHSPLLSNILTPGGKLSMPYFIASKATSSETGVDVHLL